MVRLFRNQFLFLLRYGLSLERFRFLLQLLHALGVCSDSYAGSCAIYIHLMGPDLVLLHITGKEVTFSINGSGVRRHLFHGNLRAGRFYGISWGSRNNWRCRKMTRDVRKLAKTLLLAVSGHVVRVHFEPW